MKNLVSVTIDLISGPSYRSVTWLNSNQLHIFLSHENGNFSVFLSKEAAADLANLIATTVANSSALDEQLSIYLTSPKEAKELP
jgi:hypothetical protein